MFQYGKFDRRAQEENEGRKEEVSPKNEEKLCNGGSERALKPSQSVRETHFNLPRVYDTNLTLSPGLI